VSIILSPLEEILVLVCIFRVCFEIKLARSDITVFERRFNTWKVSF